MQEAQSPERQWLGPQNHAGEHATIGWDDRGGMHEPIPRLPLASVEIF